MFEDALLETVAFYIAGVRGEPVPKARLIHTSDARRIYSAGYEKGLDALASIPIEPAYFVDR